jgi:hypothetical protein
MSLKDKMADLHATRRKIANPSYKYNSNLLHQTPAFLKACSAHTESSRIYVAGAYTGRESYARSQFAIAAESLRKNYPDMEVINPLEDLGLSHDTEWEACIATCIYALLKCQRIFLLPGWSESRGATIEHAVARKHGLMVVYDGKAEHAPFDTH